MKKILAVFLLLAIASACSAQVETGGLVIPGDDAVQVVRKTTDYESIREGALAEYWWEDYTPVPGGTAVWLDSSGNGRDLTQSTETNKPATSTDGLSFTNDYMSFSLPSYVTSQEYLMVVVASCTQDPWTDYYACAALSSGTTPLYFLWLSEPNKYELYPQALNGFSFNGGTTIPYGGALTVGYTAQRFFTIHQNTYDYGFAPTINRITVGTQPNATGRTWRGKIWYVGWLKATMNDGNKRRIKNYLEKVKGLTFP